MRVVFDRKLLGIKHLTNSSGFRWNQCIPPDW